MYVRDTTPLFLLFSSVSYFDATGTRLRRILEHVRFLFLIFTSCFCPDIFRCNAFCCAIRCGCEQALMMHDESWSTKTSHKWAVYMDRHRPNTVYLGPPSSVLHLELPPHSIPYLIQSSSDESRTPWCRCRKRGAR